MIKKIITTILIGVLITFQVSCDDDIEVTGRANTKKPVADFKIESDLYQANQKIIFTDLSSDNDGFITEWNWNFGDGTISKEQSPEHFFAVGGTFKVILKVADNTGSFSQEITKVVTIADDPLANIADPEILWSFTLDGKLNHSSPAVSDDGTVYIGFNQAARENQGPDFVAIKNGNKVWEQVFFEGGAQKSDQVKSSPAIASDGTIYSSSYYSRTVWHLSASDGSIIGSKNLNTRMRYTSPTFASDGSVYIAGYSKNGKGFYSLDPTLNTVNWVFKQGTSFNATPAIATNGTIYIPSTDDFLYALNPDGTEKWSAEYGTWTATAIALSVDGTVYLSAETATGGVLIAFDPSNGSEKWRNVLPAKVGHGGVAIAQDGTIYLGGYEEKMIAYNPDGTEKWSYAAKGAIETVPAIDNEGNIYFGDMAGFFHVVNPNGLNPYKVIKLGDEIHSSAVIGSDGAIYVAANEGGFGKVYALKTTATSLAQTGWPMFGKDAKHTGR